MKTKYCDTSSFYLVY